ncbi:MAG: DEAD/DEAH box helicase [Gemmatimonadetes bacterium]|nr:DEAD/DEAH box helicase [Gemmatimonadota bacterium]
MQSPLELSAPAAEQLRREIRRARGNEVCFAAAAGTDGTIASVRAVARGNRAAVLAATRDLPAGTLLIHNHPGGDLTPSEADLGVAAQLYAAGLGLAITDNEASELYVVVEPVRSRELQLLDAAEVAALLAPGGPVAREHPAYEDRPTQRDLASQVTGGYNQGGVQLAEAGTGTGKTVAYLIPAILWAVRNGERTVVSTNTINLQEQLVGKDLPFLRRALGEAFTFALVKGRGNYVSIRRAQAAAATAELLLDGAQAAELQGLLAWLERTRDGSLQDLPFEPTAELWDEVMSDSDVCLRARCPHFQVCFYQRARRDASAADVLVVNHHLLFSDIAVRRPQQNYSAPAVLPPYRRLILDEAHNLEDAATEHLGASVSRRGLLRLLGRLERRGKGLLPAVAARLQAAEADLLRQETLQELTEVVHPALERARELTIDFFGRLEFLLRDSDEHVLRLAGDFSGMEAWAEGVAPVLDDLVIALERLARGLRRVRELVQTDQRWSQALIEPLVELGGVQQRVLQAIDAIRLAATPGTDPTALVRWIERRGADRARPNLALNAAPVDLSQLLRDALFEPMHTVVLTSATLTTRDGFAFLRQRLGLGAGLRVQESVHPSSFDFATQTLVVLPNDLPEPGRDGDSRFDVAVAGTTEDLARVSDGGLFVLFTSYRSLKAVAAQLRARGAERRWPVFVQGEAPRARLLESFTHSGRGLLLGVASFWEGVDVPGEPLRGLLIARLPFKVPTEPLTAARLEAIEAYGGNSFHDYMLPHAALRLKQGFGRLIRARTDRGAVVILDRRIHERGYGRYILSSLPPAPVLVGSWPGLLARLREFYSATDGSPRA